MPIDFRIRDFLIPLPILELKRSLDRTQWMPPETLGAYQERRLSRVMRHAWEQVPYYRRVFERRGLRPGDIARPEDLPKLPVLGKEAVWEAGHDLLARDADRYGPRRYRTSGTTGRPLTLYHDRHTRALEFVYYWRYWGWAGYRLGDRFAEFGSQYFLLRSALRDRLFAWQPHLNRLMLSSAQVSLRNAPRMADAVRRYRPRFLKGMPSALYFFALALQHAGIDDLAFRAVFSTGEVVTPQCRALLERVFHCRVLDSYGHMERTVAVCQCPRGSYHINSDYGILELVNARAMPDGRSAIGEVVGTSLHNMSMPLIRYDVGDHIECATDGRMCPCGRTLPVATAIHGRTEDAIVTPDGRFVTSAFILPELVQGVSFAQFIQESERVLQVNVVPDGEWNEREESRFLSQVRHLVGPEMTVRVACVSADALIRDASGKTRAVISHVKAGLPEE